MGHQKRNFVSALAVAASLQLAFASGASALDISIGGVSASVDLGGGGVDASVDVGGAANVDASVGGGGVEASASVGDTASVSASVGGGGVGASVGVGSGTSVDVGLGSGGLNAGISTGTPSGGTPGAGQGATTGAVGVTTLAQARASDIRAAQRVRCRNNGNSQVMNGYVVRDPGGIVMGVIHDAWVDTNLNVSRVRFATTRNLGQSRCITVSTTGSWSSPGSITVPYRAEDIAMLVR